MKKTVGALMLLVALLLCSVAARAGDWQEGRVAKVIQGQGLSLVALRLATGGPLVYLELMGSAADVDRLLALALMAQADGIPVHVLYSAGRLQALATVSDDD